jgi:hypothetical protein
VTRGEGTRADDAERDPFRLVSLTIETIDSGAGSRHTLTAIAVALHRARLGGTKTLFAMPTLELVRKMVEFARRADKRRQTRIT